MPMNINVGLSKKIGLPDYGSLGASCSVAFEAEHGLLELDLEAFCRRVQKAFAACRQSVDDELTRQRQPEAAIHGQGRGREDGHCASSLATPNGNGAGGNGEHGRRNGNGNGNGHRVSTKQLSFIRTLAGSVPGLGVRHLDSISQKMFGKPLADLSSLDGSGLIDVLRDVQAGKIELAKALEGASI